MKFEEVKNSPPQQFCVNFYIAILSKEYLKDVVQVVYIAALPVSDPILPISYWAGKPWSEFFS